MGNPERRGDGGSGREPALPLATLAQSLREAYAAAAGGARDDALKKLLSALSSAISPITGASITVAAPSPHTAAATNELAQRGDDLQYGLGRGPCLSATTTGSPVFVGGSEDEPGRTSFAWLLAATGCPSLLSWPLPGGGGAVNLYSEVAREFDRDAQHVVAIYAAAVAFILTTSELLAHHEHDVRIAAELQRALDSRVLIEQAKGILMAQRRISAPAAFRLLVSASQRENKRIHDIAQRVVDSVTQ